MKFVYTMLLVCLVSFANAQTVVDIIVNSPDHTTLETAVIAAELADDLSGVGPFTVFAPTDAAFAALPPATLNALLADPTGDLAKILLHHVLGAEVLSTDLSDGQVATTVLGQGITVSFAGNDIFIDNAKVTLANIDATNGVVHVLDAVLLPESSNVAEVVVNSPNHTTLETAVVAAGLAGALSGDGPFTVFAPTDAAFAALPMGALDDLLADPTGDLAKVLLYHVVGADVASSDLSDGQAATTLLGQGIDVTINGDGVFINDAKVSVTDIQTFNGVVHVLDAVLLPPAETVVDVVVNSEVHNTLETAVVQAGLAGALSGDGPFTVFAPTDAAFAALPMGALDDLLVDPTGDLAKVLLYHVVGADVASSDLSDGQAATTLLGQGIDVTINGDGVFINDAKVSVTDIQTFNGVVHVLDAVLLPPAETVVDVVVNSEVHTTLETAVVQAGLAGTLSGDGPFTVFAPTDAAFAALPMGALDDLLVDPTGDLAKVLLYHVVGADVASSDLSDGQAATTLLGQGIDVTINGDGVFINDAKVSVTDIQTFNGVVHVLDAVLLPPAETVVDVVVNSEVHTTLETAVIAAKLDDDLSNRDAFFTLFAPTDAAFAALPPGTVDDLLVDPEGELANILLYHALGAEVLSSSLTDGQTAGTLSTGNDVTVTFGMGGEVMINDAMVVIADIRTYNGVVHVLDAVLLPTTAVSNLNQVSIEVMPNPASDYININMPQEMISQEVNAELIGINGAILKNWQINDIRSSVDVSAYPAGTYFLLLKTETDFARSTVIID